MTKKLGFGFMRLPLLNIDDQTAIDYDCLNELVDTYMDNGFNYFDTAWMYHNAASEEAIKRAVVDRYDRDRFQLATKLPPFMVQSPEDQVNVFNTQLEKCGVEYFDNYLIHNLGATFYPMAQNLGTFEFVREMKEEGKAKHIGFSYHDNAELLDQILTEHPEMEFVQLQINYMDWEDQGIQSRLCYEVARKHNKPVIVMEPLKGGNIAAVPSAAEELMKVVHPTESSASWAMRYVGGLEGVQMVLSGMNTMEQLRDNMATFTDLTPLNEKEREIIGKVTDIIAANTAVPCTTCRYCVEECPVGIPIPDFFALYNNSKQAITDVNTPQFVYYMNLSSKHAKASDCTECESCVEKCPQHIDIPGVLKNIVEIYESRMGPPPEK